MKTEVVETSGEGPKSIAASPTETHWIVVSQVKSYRVVYFTDDPDYVPPSQGDWYYVSPYRGPLPKGMTLRNCWRWRFNGHEFVDAGAMKAKQGFDPLLESNKEALRKLLRDKIDAVRRPYAPHSLLGERVRAAKLVEARSLVDDGLQPLPSGYLMEVAAARGWSVPEAAQRIIELHEEENLMLRQTEQWRESIAVSIDAAQTQETLISLRSRLMDEIAPELNALFAVKPPANTTPKDRRESLSSEDVSTEQLRLRIELRERINALRRPFVSHYLLDDLVLKHRGRIAQAVMAAGGALPPGLDGTSLLSYAAARGRSLLEAAEEVLFEMNEAAKALLETEQMKDAMLSRIAAVTNFADVQKISSAIRTLSLQEGSK